QTVVGAPNAAAVQAFSRASARTANGAPSIRSDATSCPAESTTTAATHSPLSAANACALRINSRAYEGRMLAAWSGRVSDTGGACGDGEDDTGDPGRIIGGKEGASAGPLVRLSEPAERVHRSHALQHFFVSPRAGIDRRPDVAGAERVGCD